MTTIPTLPDGRHDWATFVKTIKPGDTITLPKSYQGTAPKCIATHGFNVGVSCRSGNLVINILEAKASLLKRTDRTGTIKQAEAREANIPARLHQALQNAKYWSEKKHLAPTAEARTQAAARALAWKIQCDSLQAQLDAQQLTTVSP